MLERKLLGIFVEHPSGVDYEVFSVNASFVSGEEIHKSLAIAERGGTYEIPESSVLEKFEIDFETGCGRRLIKLDTDPISFQFDDSNFVLVSKPLELTR
jgi:hypothetical protein